MRRRLRAHIPLGPRSPRSSTLVRSFLTVSGPTFPSRSYPRLKSKLRAMTWNCYIFSILMLVVEFGNFGYSIWVLRVKFGVKIQCASQTRQLMVAPGTASVAMRHRNIERAGRFVSQDDHPSGRKRVARHGEGLGLHHVRP